MGGDEQVLGGEEGEVGRVLLLVANLVKAIRFKEGRKEEPKKKEG